MPTGTAVFGNSTTRNISFSADTTIGGWSSTFQAGYTFTNTHFLAFNGAGIASDLSATITNTIGGHLVFLERSSAGNASITNNEGSIDFWNFSSAEFRSHYQHR